MASWNSRSLNRSLTSYKTKQRYKYQLYDYLKAIKNKPQFVNQEYEENYDDKLEAIML